jgi:hypothetical protein
MRFSRVSFLAVVACVSVGGASIARGQGSSHSAQQASTTPGGGKYAHPPDVAKPPTKDDLLRGGYGPYRANNDLLFYALKLRVDPEAKTIAGTNLVRFKMLEDGQKIQLELSPDLTIGAITFDGNPLKYTHEE